MSAPINSFSFPRRSHLLSGWLAAVAALAILTPASAANSDDVDAVEKIGAVEDIYDGTLLPDDAVATFRNIDRLFVPG